MINRDPYVRRARCIRVIDGDTLELDVDLGWHITIRTRARLLNCDAHEHQPGGADATRQTTAWTIESLTCAPDANWPLIIRSTKSDAFGRFLIEIWNHRNESLILHLLENHLAQPWPSILT